MNRLKSLDVMRGLTVALMILVNNGGEHNYSFLEHSKWNGLTPVSYTHLTLPTICSV